MFYPTMKFFIKICSYLFPVVVKRYETPSGQRLYVTYENGKKVLNSANANYSFGSLERIFRLVLRRSHFSVSPSEKVLILGLGGGSLVKILREEYHFMGKVTAVENEPVILRIGRMHFAEYQEDLELMEMDAAEFLRQNEKKYHSIFIDLFVDNQVPPAFLREGFIREIRALLLPEGQVYHNLMLGSNENLQRLEGHYRKYFNKVETLWIMGTNQVIVAGA